METASITPKRIPCFWILGVRVHIVKISDVVTIMKHWIETERDKCHWIVVTGMHGLAQAHEDPKFKCILNSADLFVPDGIAPVWIARLNGLALKKRVCGSDLMWEFSKVASENGFRNFFYGDTEDTLECLTARLLQEFPGIKIAGHYSPPFRLLTPEEDLAVLRRIGEAKPDILWVGLGLPKQECWIFEHKDQLDVPVVVGVGAAFRFVSGKVKRAPAWIGDIGLEWLWRFIHEPRKVWRRVLLDGPRFLGHVLHEEAVRRRNSRA